MNPLVIAAASELLEIAEPEIAAGLAAIIARAHRKKLTAQDYIALAQAQLDNAAPPSTGGKP